VEILPEGALGRRHRTARDQQPCCRLARRFELFEDQIANAAGQKNAVAGADLQMLRQSMERIEAKVDRIERVLDGIAE
jgi:hypothetical protein